MCYCGLCSVSQDELLVQLPELLSLNAKRIKQRFTELFDIVGDYDRGDEPTAIEDLENDNNNNDSRSVVAAHNCTTVDVF